MLVLFYFSFDYDCTSPWFDFLFSCFFIFLNFYITDLCSCKRKIRAQQRRPVFKIDQSDDVGKRDGKQWQKETKINESHQPRRRDEKKRENKTRIIVSKPTIFSYSKEISSIVDCFYCFCCAGIGDDCYQSTLLYLCFRYFSFFTFHSWILFKFLSQILFSTVVRYLFSFRFFSCWSLDNLILVHASNAPLFTIPSLPLWFIQNYSTIFSPFFCPVFSTKKKRLFNRLFFSQFFSISLIFNSRIIGIGKMKKQLFGNRVNPNLLLLNFTLTFVLSSADKLLGLCFSPFDFVTTPVRFRFFFFYPFTFNV